MFCCWKLIIWTLKDFYDLKVCDERIETDTADLKRLVVSTANAFEDLGEGYVSSEHNYLRRFIKASTLAYDAEIARLENQ